MSKEVKYSYNTMYTIQNFFNLLNSNCTSSLEFYPFLLEAMKVNLKYYNRIKYYYSKKNRLLTENAQMTAIIKSIDDGTYPQTKKYFGMIEIINNNNLCITKIDKNIWRVRNLMTVNRKTVLLMLTELRKIDLYVSVIKELNSRIESSEIVYKFMEIPSSLYTENL